MFCTVRWLRWFIQWPHGAFRITNGQNCCFGTQSGSVTQLVYTINAFGPFTFAIYPLKASSSSGSLTDAISYYDPLDAYAYTIMLMLMHYGSSIECSNLQYVISMHGYAQ